MQSPGSLVGSGVWLVVDRSGNDSAVHALSSSSPPYNSVWLARFAGGAPSDDIVDTEGGCDQVSCALALDSAGAAHVGTTGIAIRESSSAGGRFVSTILGYANQPSGYSMAIDGTGTEHLAWYGKMLDEYRAVAPQALWYRGQSAFERLDLLQHGPDGGSPTGRVSLPVEADGAPHVAFASRGVVKYGVRTGNVWNTSTIDIGPSCGEWISLALDASGRAPVIYREAAAKTLKYARSAAVSK
jgi:hypothetical protein